MKDESCTAAWFGAVAWIKNQAFPGWWPHRAIAKINEQYLPTRLSGQKRSRFDKKWNLINGLLLVKVDYPWRRGALSRGHSTEKLWEVWHPWAFPINNCGHFPQQASVAWGAGCMVQFKLHLHGKTSIISKMKMEALINTCTTYPHSKLVASCTVQGTLQRHPRTLIWE